jgi:hypothetical protein
MNTRNVYLCLPYSYSIEPEALDAFNSAADGWERTGEKLGNLRLKSSRIRSSMLCESFNGGVAAAKNGKFDDFTMIHSDIVADPGWLVLLMTARESVDADVCNAVARIKDDRGVTSTAIAYSTDIMDRKRRLTVRECAQLPETFTIEDVRRVLDPEALLLLPNPGLLSIRMGEWFYKWPGFRTESFVEHVADGDFYRAKEISEDWLFGYYCHEHGIRVAATTAVKTDHIGRKKYSTRQPEGMDCDREYFQAVGRPRVGKGRWVFPAEVDGWLSSIEGIALAKLAMGKRVLEIGSYCGKSTICMAQTAASVLAVDPHDGRATDKPQDTMLSMLKNLASYQLDNVTVERATSADWAATYAGKPFDFIFIDGDHSRDSVRKDYEIALANLAADGVIAFHDYRRTPREHDGGWDEGVTIAVENIITEGAELVDRQGTVAVVKPPAFAESV